MIWSFLSYSNGRGWLHNVTARDREIKPKSKELNKLKHFLTNKWTDLLKWWSVTSRKGPVSVLFLTVSVAHWFLFLPTKARGASWPSCSFLCCQKMSLLLSGWHDTVSGGGTWQLTFSIKINANGQVFVGDYSVIVAIRAPGWSAFSWWNWNFQWPGCFRWW